MKTATVIFFLIFVLSSPFLLQHSFLVGGNLEGDVPDFFVGIDVAYDNISEMKLLVDKISSYTNLFIIGTTGITYDTQRLDETCQYIYDKGLSFIIYTERRLQIQWVEDAEIKWGDRFLGFYVLDEVGGRQLDRAALRVFAADDYTDAANQFVNSVNSELERITGDLTSSSEIPLFTSDYALYHFDYRAGYDTILAQFGWNYSRQLNVALCRGAATVHNKEWGAIITWTYNKPPYIESGEELYDDLVLAYENGAKYIVVFDSNEPYTHGILLDEHLEALEQFWQYTLDNPRTKSETDDRVAYVLPKDYGYGFRGPDDKIWGLWTADAFSYEVSVDLGNMLEQYGSKLDVIYEDTVDPFNVGHYSKLIFWNGTIIDTKQLHIRSDGNVWGTEKIQQNENVYRLIDDINGSIIVEKDNITIDGNDFSLWGSNSDGSKGIDMVNRVGVTIKNLRIDGFDIGIYMPMANNCSVYGNQIINCENALWLFGSSYNNIAYNTFVDNPDLGIQVMYESSFNVLYGNNITNTPVVLWMADEGNIADSNYWTDYEGIDENGDEIGDTPHVYHSTSESINYTDNNPMMNPTILPAVIIPEFPSRMILPLLMATIFALVIFFRKKLNHSIPS